MKNLIHNLVVKQGITFAQNRIPKVINSSFFLKKELTYTDEDGCFCFLYIKEGSDYKIKVEYDSCTLPDSKNNFFMKLVNNKDEIINKAPINLMNFNFDQVYVKLTEGFSI